MNMRRLIVLVVIGLGLAATILAGRPAEPAPNITFDIPTELASGGAAHVTLEVHNRGNMDFNGDDAMHAVMELKHDELGVLDRYDYVSLGEVPAGGMLVLGNYRELLPPGRSTFIWGANGYGYVSLDLLVADEDGQLAIIGESKRIRRDADPPIAPGYGQADPFVARAHTDLRTRLSVPADSIRVKRIVSTRFSGTGPDNPQAGDSTYEVVTPGYIIDLVANDRSYRYHAGNDQVILTAE